MQPAPAPQPIMGDKVSNQPSANAGGVAAQGRPTPRLVSSRQRHRISCPHQLRGWRFSRHAREHIDAREFDPHEVVAACTEPEITATAYDYGPGRVRYTRGRLVVIAVPQTRQIVTALLRSYDQWDDQDARRCGATA